MAKTEPVFHLGLVMAGAVSAGAYTAGVLDYLFETLQKWEEARDRDLSVPSHRVVIDVLAGSSAGGMSAAIAAIQLHLRENGPVTRLYDAWVNLADQEGGASTLDRMLDPSDIRTGRRVRSMLNPGPIAEIGRRIIDTTGMELCRPGYAGEGLDLLMTISNLKGIPYDVSFNTSFGRRAHRMLRHKDFMHFRVNGDPDQRGILGLDLKGEEDLELLRQAAMATGAFPVGLPPVRLSRPLDYIKGSSRFAIGIDEERGTGLLWQKDLPDPYISQNVDGGLTNNEPFGEALRLLERKAGCGGEPETGPSLVDRALIMIDPFPAQEGPVAAYRSPDTLKQLIPVMFATMRNQLLFKESDIRSALVEEDCSRFLIVPSREPGSGYHIACGSLGGFGGFLERAFREHDYRLGKRNCQRFLREHFKLPVEGVLNPLFINWHEEATRRFEFERTGRRFRPVIPDMDYDYSRPGTDDAGDPTLIPLPSWPRAELGGILKLRRRIGKRIHHVVRNIHRPLNGDRPEIHRSRIVEELKRRKRFIKDLFWPLRLVAGALLMAEMLVLLVFLTRRLSLSAVYRIIADLERRGLIR